MNDWNHTLAEWDRAAWALAAAALALAGRGGRDYQDAAASLLDALEVDTDEPPHDPVGSARIGAQAASSLLQAAAAVTGDAAGWAGMPDDILLAQGHASAQGARVFAAGICSDPAMDDRLHREGARMLDVGVGVAALAVAFCDVFPTLTIVGIDVLPSALRLAEETVTESPAADRVILREQSIADISDVGCYDLAWVPAPFVPAAALTAGTSRLVRAMRPGGQVVLGHGKVSGDPVADALTRFKTLAYGGTMLDDQQAAQLLREAGFVEVTRIPTPPGAPAVTIGRAAA